MKSQIKKMRLNYHYKDGEECIKFKITGFLPINLSGKDATQEILRLLTDDMNSYDSPITDPPHCGALEGGVD